MASRILVHSRLASALRVSAAVAVGLSAVQTARAVDYTFNATPGTPADYGTASNWTPAAVPGSADAGLISGGRIAASTYTGSVGQLNLGPSGSTGAGELDVTAGALTAGNARLGDQGGTAVNTIKVTGGTFTLSNESQIGSNGRGLVSVANGAVVNLQRVNVGTEANSVGTINVTGGTLNMTTKSYIGLRGAGTFNISGGTVNGADLGVGQEGDVPGVRGVINVTGGNATFGQVVMGEVSPNDNQLNVSAGTISMTNEIYVGANGKATMNLSGTGTINVLRRIHLGASSGINGTTGVGSSGTINITGGTLNATDPDVGWILCGDGGTGSYTQSAGAVTVSRFAVGQNDQAIGTATVSGGTLRSRLTLVVGESSPLNNVFNISAGSADIGTATLDPEGNGIFVGSGHGTGTINVSGTGALSSRNPIIIGFGKYGTSDGTVNISNGSLSTVTSGDNGNVRIGVYAGTTGRLNVTGGTVTIAGSLYNAVYDIPGGGGLGGTGIVTIGGGTLTAAATENEGTYTQTAGTSSLGTVTGGGSIAVSGGTTNVARLTQASLALSGTGTVKIANAASPAASVVGSFTSAGTSKLDVSNNGLVIDYTGATSPQSSIRTALAAGRISSTLTPADARQSVAYAEASTLGITSFLGTPVDSTAVVIRARLNGDTNFSGTVDFADLLTLAKKYNLASGALWTDGDSNYDGAVTFADLLSLAKNYSVTVPASADAVGDAQFRSDWALAQSLVPEPTSLVGLVAAAGLLSRRGSSRTRVATNV